jgi:putative transposase
VRYAFIKNECQGFTVKRCCVALGVSEQGYYQYLHCPISRRAKENQVLSDKVQVLFSEHKRRYGSVRLWHELKESGVRCGKHRVARLMRERQLRAKAARKYRPVTTSSKHTYPVAPNTLNRAFTVAAPNNVWCGDITYLRTTSGWMYLAVFIDLFSRRVVGWSLSDRLAGSVVYTAFEKACMKRNRTKGLLIHTDRGVQYAADAFKQYLQIYSCSLSMSRKGNCWDNAVVESFFHTLKVEAIHNEQLADCHTLEHTVFEYIEHYYNTKRKHSTLDYVSPARYELEYYNKQSEASSLLYL